MSYLPPCRQAFANETAVSIAQAAPETPITWVVKPFTVNDDLLDLTNPLLPVVRQAGFYIVSGFMSVVPQVDPTTGIIYSNVELDYDGEDARVRAFAQWDDSSEIPFSIGYFIPDGGTLRASVLNGLDVGVDVRLTAYLVRLPV